MQEPLQIGHNHNRESKKPTLTGGAVARDEMGRFLPGHVKIGGKKAGKRDFSNEWDEFVERVAIKNGMTPEQVEDQIRSVAFSQAQAGNFSFYKDIVDRLYGGSSSKIELDATVTTSTTPITPHIAAAIAKANEVMREAVFAPHKQP